jgi:hypothetical protein
MTIIPPERPPKRCIGMVANSRSVLVQCPEIVTSTRRKYHSKKCLEWTHARRALGYVLGDVYVKCGRGKRWREKVGLPLDPRTSPGRCIGMVVDSNHILVQCPAKVKPGEYSLRDHSKSYVRYHSKACYMWTRRRQRDGLALGDIYIKWQRRKHHQPKRCQGWIVRDGVIAQCTETFTAVTTRQKHHSLACMYQTRRWRKIGYRPGDSVRRTCGYRNCKKGDGGTRKTFDRIGRNKSGQHFCCNLHNTAESNARMGDRLAKAERILARPKGGHPKEDKRGFRVNELYLEHIKWHHIHKTIESEFKVHTTIKALQELRKRFVERQSSSI